MNIPKRHSARARDTRLKKESRNQLRKTTRTRMHMQDRLASLPQHPRAPRRTSWQSYVDELGALHA